MKELYLKKVFDLWGYLVYSGKRSDVVDYDEALIKSADLWLRKPPSDKPWILLLPLIFPHYPFAVEEPYFSMYDRKLLPAPSDRRERRGYEQNISRLLEKHMKLKTQGWTFGKRLLGCIME